MGGIFKTGETKMFVCWQKWSSKGGEIDNAEGNNTRKKKSKKVGFLEKGHSFIVTEGKAEWIWVPIQVVGSCLVRNKEFLSYCFYFLKNIS